MRLGLEHGEIEIHAEYAGKRPDHANADRNYGKPLQQSVGVLRHPGGIEIIARQDSISRPFDGIDETVIGFCQMGQVMAVLFTNGGAEVRPVQHRNSAAVLRDDPPQARCTPPQHRQRVERIMFLSGAEDLLVKRVELLLDRGEMIMKFAEMRHQQ